MITIIIVGIDASFTRLGYSVIDTERKIIFIDSLPGKRGSTFQSVFQNAIIKANELIKSLKDYDIDYVISEEPFIGREASEGLFLLDGIINYSLLLKGVKEIYNTHPSYLKTLHGAKYTKSDSVNLAKEIIEVYKQYGFTFNKVRYNDDESESFLFATRLYLKKNKDLKFYNDILQVNKKFELEREKLLYIKS